MRGYRWDAKRGMVAINRSPDVLDISTPEELKHYIATGEAPYTEEPPRCPSCGRSKDCECRNCRYCVDGVPMHGQSWDGINGGKLPNGGVG